MELGQKTPVLLLHTLYIFNRSLNKRNLQRLIVVIAIEQFHIHTDRQINKHTAYNCSFMYDRRHCRARVRLQSDKIGLDSA